MANKIIKGIEGAGKAIGAGVKNIMSKGSFSPNYIEKKMMPKQASDFARKQKQGAPKILPNAIPGKGLGRKAIPNAVPKKPNIKQLPKKVAPTFKQVQDSVKRTMGK